MAGTPGTAPPRDAATAGAGALDAPRGGEVEQRPEGLKRGYRVQGIEGVPTAEVCETLDITEANVWVRLHRARKRLAERLSHHLEPA